LGRFVECGRISAICFLVIGPPDGFLIYSFKTANKTTIMKKFLLIMALWCLTTSISFAQIKSASLKASGLTCSMCSKAIYKSLQKVPSVKEVAVDIETSVYTITFRQSAAVSIDAVKKAVENAGFSIASMQVTAAFPKLEIANDAHFTIGGLNLHFLNVRPQTIEGEKTVTVVDKSYLPPAENKKYSAYTRMPCFETGMMAACCPGGKQPSGRIYHVTL
jgi:copper chaperone CopZ